MKLYSESKNYKLYQGNMLDMLDVIEPNSVDSIVTDPPYEIGFMGKSWDNSGIAFQKETWEKCLRVLKPGGHLLAFGGSRTYHRIACAIEDAGFEIRDCIMYIYGSGFPKSMNIGLAIDKKNGIESKVIGVGKSGVSSRAYQSEETTTAGAYQVKQAQNEWKGWGSAMKPAYEPIIVARKPFSGTLVDNVMEYGVGGINIDECRVPAQQGEYDIRHYTKEDCFQNLTPKKSQFQVKPQLEGRFPANIIHDGSEEATKDMPTTKNNTQTHTAKNSNNNINFNASKEVSVIGYSDEGSVSRYFKTCEFSELDDEYYDEPKRYFYCAKASKQDRDEGLEGFENKVKVFNGQSSESSKNIKDVKQRFTTVAKNVHPTVKPTSLMAYLVRLVTPKGGTILDPFNGSGSTGKATMLENAENNKEYKYIGVELTEEYLPISKARIEFGEHYNPVVKKETKKQKETTKSKRSLI